MVAALVSRNMKKKSFSTFNGLHAGVCCRFSRWNNGFSGSHFRE